MPTSTTQPLSIPRPDLEARTQAMGQRLQAEYLPGAIPYLREHEPELWAGLTALDAEETLEALLAYERLFFEGLRRCHLHLQQGLPLVPPTSPPTS
jgi:hypothetical protein